MKNNNSIECNEKFVIDLITNLLNNSLTCCNNYIVIITLSLKFCGSASVKLSLRAISSDSLAFYF